MNPYPSYKESGVEWVGKIPIGWEFIPLKYICYMKGRIGWKGLKQDEFLDNGEYYLITGHDIKDDKIDWNKCYHISKDRYEESPEIMIQENDLLFTKDGTIGKTLFIDKLIKPTSLNSHLLVIRPKNNRYISKFLQYIFKSIPFLMYVNLNKTGTTFYGVSQDTMENFRGVFPPLQEQQQISNYLDHKTQKIDSLIQKTQQKIELLKEQRISLINQVVTKGLKPDVEMKDSGVEWIGEIPSGWEIRRIWSLGKFSKGRGIKKDEVKDNGIPCIRYGEIYTDYERVVYSTKSFIDEETSQNSEPIKKGDVLFTGSGETLEDIGKSIVYYGDSTVFVGGDIIILQLNEDIDPLFSSFMMNSHYVNSQKTQSGRGGIIVHIYPKQLNEIRVTLPLIEEQQQIVEYLDEQTQKIDSTIEKETQRLDLLKEYRQSLISNVVTGKVDVRDEVLV